MANLPSYTSLMGAMFALERQVSDFQYGLASTTASKTVSGVTVVANGLGKVVSITFDAATYDGYLTSVPPATSASVAATLMNAANQALAAAITTAQQAAVAFAQSLSLPGLPPYGGGTPSYPGFAPLASLVSSTVLANNPCEQPRSFTCSSGPVQATVDSHRVITSLVIDEPLPDFSDYLGSSAVSAINCAVTKSTNPPENVHNAVGGITGNTVTFETLCLYANDSLDVEFGSQIRGIGGQGWGMIANAGDDTTSVGANAAVGTIVSRGGVSIGLGASVHGSIRSEGSVNVGLGAHVDGPITQNTAVVLPILKVGVVFPAQAQPAVDVLPLATKTVAPAYYRSITVGTSATLNVSSGVYYTDALNLNLGARIVVDAANGPVIFWVKSNLIFQGSLVDKAGVFPRIWIGYIGSLVVQIVSGFQGSLVAPNARVSLAGRDMHIGSFHAQTLEVENSLTVWYRPFELPFNQIPGARPPDPPAVPIPAATAAVLGFEDAAAWTATRATLALVTTPITQGAHSLRVSNIASLGASPVVSRAFSATGVYAPSGQLLLDVFIPTASGTIDIQAKIPSQGINLTVSFGAKSLTGKPTNAYSTLTYTVPANVLTALASAPSDVTLSIVFNVQLNAGTFFLDNLRFQ